jgi:aspartyl-tRNA(Asn)/glutamyl-tRNA(Gln) amidotransferase subunit C
MDKLRCLSPGVMVQKSNAMRQRQPVEDRHAEEAIRRGSRVSTDPDSNPCSEQVKNAHRAQPAVISHQRRDNTASPLPAAPFSTPFSALFSSGICPLVTRVCAGRKALARSAPQQPARGQAGVTFRFIFSAPRALDSMALTSQDIARVANLARLELRPDETERVLRQLNGFFALVAQMEAVDTEGVAPLAHPAALLGEVALRLRDDIASEPNQREASQVSAPAVERGLFLVPKVIE